VRNINNNLNQNKCRVLLGKNIVYFRQLHGWSQETLAQKMNADSGYISRVENAKKRVSIDYIEKLCQVFDIEPKELFDNRNFNLKSRVDSREK